DSGSARNSPSTFPDVPTRPKPGARSGTQGEEHPAPHMTRGALALTTPHQLLASGRYPVTPSRSCRIARLETTARARADCRAMSRFARFQPRLYAHPALAALAPLSALLAAGAQAQPQQPPQLPVAPNPYRRIDAWLHAPAGRTIGSVSSVAAARDGSVWIAERYGAND